MVGSFASDLIVMNPQALAKEFPAENGMHRIQSKLSNIGFGNIQVGATRTAQLIVPQPKHDLRGCRPFNWTDFDTETLDFDPNAEPRPQGFFMVLQRGGCSFQKKAKHA